jgi:hypothetical protein
VFNDGYCHPYQTDIHVLTPTLIIKCEINIGIISSIHGYREGGVTLAHATSYDVLNLPYKTPFLPTDHFNQSIYNTLTTSFIFTVKKAAVVLGAPIATLATAASFANTIGGSNSIDEVLRFEVEAIAQVRK